MTKELELLEPSVLLEFIDGLLKRYENKTDYNIYITKDWLLEIKQAIKRLEAIDNVNPSEALECLEKVSDYLNNVYDYKEIIEEVRKDIDTIKAALLKSQANTRSEEILQKYYQEGITLDSVRALKQERDNYKKVLEIIKEKNVDVLLIKKYDFVEDYNSAVWISGRPKLVKEEFNVLKEVLE